MANLNFNKVILGGRLTGDPELKTTPSGQSVTSFSLAVNRSGDGKKTDFFNVQAWRSTAEFVSKYFRKGSSIVIVGKIQNREWTDQNGQKRYATEIKADEATFVDSKGESQSVDQQGAQQAAQPSYMPDGYTTPPAPKFEELGDDDELPF